MITAYLKNHFVSHILAVSGFTENDNWITFTYSPGLGSDQCMSFFKDGKNGYNLTIGNITYTPEQVIENPNRILALMQTELLNDNIEALP